MEILTTPIVEGRKIDKYHGLVTAKNKSLIMAFAKGTAVTLE